VSRRVRLLSDSPGRSRRDLRRAWGRRRVLRDLLRPRASARVATAAAFGVLLVCSATPDPIVLLEYAVAVWVSVFCTVSLAQVLYRVGRG